MDEKEALIAEPFKPQLRLVIQASIPIGCAEEGDANYNEIAHFLLVFSPDITLNGQIIKMLEPCCKEKPVTPSAARGEKQETKDHEKSP